MKGKFGNVSAVGNGGGLLSNAFLRQSLDTGGTQEGVITRKPKYLTHYDFDAVNFIPYDFTILASGIILVIGFDSVTTTSKVKVYHLRVPGSFQYIDEFDFEEDLSFNIDANPQILASGNFAYVFAHEKKIVKLDISNLGNITNLGEFVITVDQRFYDISLYKNLILVGSLRTTSQDPGLFVIETETMTLKNFLRASDPADFNTISSIQVKGDYSYCLSNVAPGTSKFLTIIKNDNLETAETLDIISVTPFSIPSTVARQVRINGETVLVVGNSDARFISIGNKVSPTVHDIFYAGSQTYGCFFNAKYMAVTWTRGDRIGVFNAADLDNPFLIDGWTLDDIYLDQVSKIRSFGPYLLTISTAETRCLCIWHVNAYSFSAIDCGPASFSGNAFFRDNVKIGQDLYLDSNVYGHNAEFIGEVGAKNIPRSRKIVRSLSDFPPLKWIERDGDVDVTEHDKIYNIDTSDLKVGMSIRSGIIYPHPTYILQILDPNSLRTSQPANLPGAYTFIIDEHIDLEDEPGVEFWIDTPQLVNPYPIQAATSRSSALHAIGESVYIYTGAGAALRGDLPLNIFFALLGKFFYGQTQDENTARIFDFTGDPTQRATVFIENLVTVFAGGYIDVGNIDGLNFSGLVGQLVACHKGLRMNDAYKIKFADWSFSDGDGICLSLTGTITNITAIRGWDVTTSGSGNYFFYMDPATVQDAADRGTQISLIECLMEGPKEQYWAPGSATGSDPGIKVIACSPIPDSTASGYIYKSYQAVQTELVQGYVRPINIALEEIPLVPNERFVLTAAYPPFNRLLYTGVDDIVAKPEMTITASFDSSVDITGDFAFARGDLINQEVAIVDTGQPSLTRIDFNGPHGYVAGDPFIIYNTITPSDPDNPFNNVFLVDTVINSTTVLIGEPFKGTTVGLQARWLDYSEVTREYRNEQGILHFSSKVPMRKDQYVFATVRNFTNNANLITNDVQFLIDKV